MTKPAADLGHGRSAAGPGRRSSPDKTDKRDAIRLARRLGAGELTMGAVPSVEHEQLRDLVRCREDIRGDLMRARHRLGKFLLRREIYYEGRGEAWSRRHRAWPAGLRFADRPSQLTIADYLPAHDVLLARREQIEAELEQLASDSPWKVTIGSLRCLRGIDTLSALGLCAEVGAFDRFGHPDQLSAYLGIVPSENTTDQQRRQGAITKAGSTTPAAAGRGRLPLSAPPGVGQTLERRQRDQPAEIINIAWRAQRRLHARWRQLKHARGKRKGIVAVAIARELAGFCWELATWEQARPDRVPPASMPAGDPLTQETSLPPKHEVAVTT